MKNKHTSDAKYGDERTDYIVNKHFTLKRLKQRQEASSEYRVDSPIIPNDSSLERKKYDNALFLIRDTQDV